MSSLKLNTASGGSVTLLPENSTANVTLTLPADNSALVSALDLAGPEGAASVGYLPAGVNSVPTTVQAKLREWVSVKDFGAPTDGTDATAAINASILAAQKSKANQLANDEIYSVTVSFEAGKDYKINGPILVPSGVILDGNGCRLVGQYGSAGTEAYDANRTSVIETGYYDGTTIVSNRTAGNYEKRIFNTVIKNFSFVNANCGINATNLTDDCKIQDCSFSNCSQPVRLKSSWYINVENLSIRGSSKFTNQAAVYVYGNDPSQSRYSNIVVVGASVGLAFDPVAGMAGNIVSNCAFEEMHKDAVPSHDLNGTAIYFANGYVQGVTISNTYFEFCQTGIRINDAANTYGVSICENYFSGCRWAIISGVNGMRNGRWFSNGTIDDGGIIRNLVDFSAAGNDVEIQLPGKGSDTSSGVNNFPTNYILGSAGYANTSSYWKDTGSPSSAIARSTPGLANQNHLNEMPFEGANIVTLPNQVPFADIIVGVNTLTINTLLAYDRSNVLVFNFSGITDTLTYSLQGFIFMNANTSTSVVSWVTHDPVGVTLTVNNNGGYVQLIFGNLTAASTINTYGFVRHV